MSRRRQANMRISYEMLEALLGLDNRIQIDTVQNVQNRNIIDVFISSDEENTNPRLYDHGEGQEIIQTAMVVDVAVERMREFVRLWDEQHTRDDAQEESRNAMRELYSQLRGNNNSNNNTGH